ncbi:reverse transcriptase (RNA-dependent DNA polymerase) [Trypanosoma vivax]|nr:reverse transcriptase (RNA-dependent DNA polymerase) [Trypanosoma vivax]
MPRSTKATHAPEMKIPSTRRSAFRPITEAELDVALRELSSGTAPGDDEIHCEELKQLGRVSRRCILRLFNCSLRTGQVQAKWRHGIIVPLLKPNKPANSMASFRPVTLTSALCKLMERIVARRVRDCIEDKLEPQQAGLRPARSTLDTLMQVTSAVRRRKDGTKTADVFIDYARAFDSVDHGCIVKALLPFGVGKHLVAWIAYFLKERTAQVRVNNVLSEDIWLTRGVPQGSVLGPLPFIVTVDSLSKRPNCIHGLQHGFFSGDLTIVCTSADLSEIQQTIQKGLDCITHWLAEYYMEVLAEKTEYTLFGTRETNLLSLKVGETALKEERTPTLLCLTKQPHKGLRKHVLCMKAAASTRLMQLRAVASPEWGPDREKLRPFYLALVQAKMCYGVSSWWFDTSLSARERLERVQAQAEHSLAGAPKAANREDALCEARLKPINEVAHRRALEYYPRLKAKGPAHAKVADSIFPSEHPIYIRLANVQHLYSIIDSTEKPHDAKVLQWARRVHFNATALGSLKADAPEKDKKVHTMRRVQRFSDFDYQVWADGSVVLSVSSGAGALVYPKDGRREVAVLGAGSLACSHRAECVAMEAGLNRLVEVIELSKTPRTRVPAFTDSLSLSMALSAGHEVVDGAMLRRIWDLSLHIVRLRASVNFQFVFAHCGVPRNEAAYKAAERGNTKPQSYPAWICDMVTGVDRHVRNEMYRAFEEDRMPRTHRSVLLDHVQPAPKHTKADRLGESLLAQFRTGTSEHCGWLHRVLTRKADQLQCRWCSAQDAASDAAVEHPLVETVADSASAPDHGIVTRKGGPIICPLCNMVCSRRQAGVVQLVKIHGLKRDCALALTKKARRAALTYKSGYTCHVCGEDFARRGLLVGHMATHPPDVVPTVEERPKRPREEDTKDDGDTLKFPQCAKKHAAHAWLQKRMLQKRPEKQISSGPKEAQDAPDSDGEAEQEEHEQTEFVCQQCHRVLKSKTWLTRHKCTASSIIDSEDSNVAEQSVTAACPICCKECHYRWLLRHMLTKHPDHDESLRPQPRAKPERKGKRKEAQAQDDGSESLESSGAGDVERPRKRQRPGRHTEGEEWRDYVCGRCCLQHKQ